MLAPSPASTAAATAGMEIEGFGSPVAGGAAGGGTPGLAAMQMTPAGGDFTFAAAVFAR